MKDAAHAAVAERIHKKEEKEAAELRKTNPDLPEPIYPTIEEAFASPTPQP